MNSYAFFYSCFVIVVQKDREATIYLISNYNNRAHFVGIIISLYYNIFFYNNIFLIGGYLLVHATSDTINFDQIFIADEL